MGEYRGSKQPLQSRTWLGRGSIGQWRDAYGRRLARAGAEACYDAAAWVGGLFFAARDTGALQQNAAWPLSAAGSVLVICVLSVGSGLLAGLYRGRYQRGSLEEVLGVSTAGIVMLLALTLVNGLPITAQQMPLQTTFGGGLIAVPAIMVARHVLCAARQRHRARARAGVKVIVFGAGDAGTALISRLLAEPNATYRPVAILDDDPDKRRLRIRGIPVLGDRTRLAEVAAETGATVLVIAIVRPSGTVIRDLTDAGGAVRPGAQGGADGLASCSAAARGSKASATRGSATCSAAGRSGPTSKAIAGYFAGKRILVTGAGGSIGVGAVPPAAPVRARRADHAGPGRVGAARRPARRCTAGRCSTPTRPCSPTSATRAGSARSSSGSGRRSCSTPRRSSTCRCSSATRPRRCRATSWAPRRCSRPPPRAASSRS